MLSCVAIFTLWGFKKNQYQAPSYQTNNTIVLGASLPLSGINNHLGEDILMGANAYFKHINANGGINGKMIEFIYYDDQYEPENTLANTQTLIEKDNVFALFSFAGTPTIKKVLPFIAQNGIPFVAPYTGASFLKENVPNNVINFRSSYEEEIQSLVEHLIKIRDISKFSIFYQNDEYGEDGYIALIKILAKHHLVLSSEGTYKRNTLSIKQAVHDIQSTKPEAIILIGSDKPTALFIEKMRETNNNSVIFCPISFANTSNFMQELNNNADNILFSQTVPSYDDFLSRDAVEFNTLFKRYYPDKKPSLVSFESYLNAKITLKALENSEWPITKEAFMHNLKNSDAKILDKMPLSYRRGQLFNQVYLSIYQNGKFYIIDRYKY